MDEPLEMRPPPPLAKRVALLVTLGVLGVLGVALSMRLVEAMGEQARMEAERVESAEAAGRAAEVEVIRPRPAEAAPLVVLTGTLEPVQAADLAFEVPGRVSRVDTTLGAHVEAGDPLVSLDRSSVGAQSAQTTAAIDVAEANAAMARDRVAMLEPLAARGSVPERELITARQQLAVIEAQVVQAQASRRQIAATSAEHTLRAPFDGVVTLVPSGVGVVASPGVPLVRVEDLSSLRLRTTVNRSELELLRPGMTARLEGSDAAGTLSAVVRSLDAHTRRAPVEVRVPNEAEALVANSFVRAHVAVGGVRAALRVPATSMRPDGTVLLIGEGNRVVEREVTAQADVDGSWLVSEGLASDDRVVLRPATARLGAVVSPVEHGEPDGAAEAALHPAPVAPR
jgi:membrane fusion protein (multidrug efflux system)